MGRQKVAHNKLDEILSRIENSSNFREIAEALLEFAIRAPSTHNSQPWNFIIRSSSIEIFLDKNLSLPEADPRGRDMIISIGCAIENLIIASKAVGVYEKIEYCTDNKIAVVHIKKNTPLKNEIDENLLQSILDWSNSRGPFTERKIDLSVFEEITNEFEKDVGFFVTTDQDIKNKIAHLTSKAIEEAHRNSIFRGEMSKWINSGFSRKKEGIPWYALHMPLIASFIIPTILKWVNMGSVLGVKSAEALKTAPVIVTIHSKDENQVSWIKVGRLAQRLMLTVRSKHFDVSIYVAAIEIGNFSDDLNRLIPTAMNVQFLFSAGKIQTQHRQTPRKKVTDKLK